MEPSYSLLLPRYIFGFNADCKGQTVHFLDKDRIAYSAGNTVVFHNVEKNSQTFLHGATEKRHGITAITISPNKEYVAIAKYGAEGGADASDPPSIVIFEAGSKKRLKTLHYPVMAAKEYVSLAFTCDGRNLASLTGPPGYHLVFWNWPKSQLLCQTRTTGGTGPVYEISTSPTDKNVICAVGKGAFRFFRYNEGVLTPFGFQKGEHIHFLSHAWLGTNDQMLAGTADGRIMLFERGEYRHNIGRVPEAELIKSHSLLPLYVGHDGQSHIFKNTAFPTRKDISALVTFSKGFAADHGTGNVIIYLRQETFSKPEKEYKYEYIIRIPADTLDPADRIVCGLALCPKEELLIATTVNSQIFMFNISNIQALEPVDLVFEYMSSGFTKGAVTGMDVATSKSVFVTAGADRFIRVWDYISMHEESVHEEYEEILCVAIHPTGHFVVAGLTDKVRVYAVLAHGINEFRDILLRGCRACAYSNGGHLLAAGNDTTVLVFSTTSFEQMHKFNGHNNMVRKLKWSVDDRKLISVGLNGEIFEWDVPKSQYFSEHEDRSMQFVDSVISPDSDSVYIATGQNTLREVKLKFDEVVSEINLEITPTCVAISRSGKLLAAGTEGGFVRSFKRPLTKENQGFDFHMHAGRVTAISVTFDGSYCLTGSSDGSIVLWKVTDPDGRGGKLPEGFVYSDTVLVSRMDMDFGLEEMQDLKTKMREFEIEMDYKLKRKDMLCQEEIKEIEAMYQAQIETLNQKIDVLKETIAESEQNFHDEVAKFEADDKLTVERLESYFKTRLIAEFEKYNELQSVIEDVILHYEQHVTTKEAHDSVTVGGRGKEMDTEVSLQAEKWEKSVRRTETTVLEAEEAIRQMEEAVDEEIQHLRKTYDHKLITLQKANSGLVVAIRMMKKNYSILQAEVESTKEYGRQLKVEGQRNKRMVSVKEMQAATLRKDMADLETNALNKEKTIFALKRINMQLEKTKYVLDHKIKELRSVVEPKSRQAIFLKQQNMEMAASLESVLAIRNGFDLQIHELADKLKSRNHKYHLEKRRRARLEVLVKRIRAELSKSMGTLHDKQALKSTVKELYEKYGRLPIIEHVEPAEQEALCELIRQLRHLEMSLKSIKEKTALDKNTSRQEQLELMHENSRRVLEIRDLRMELKVIRDRIAEYEMRLEIQPSHGYKVIEKAEKRQLVERAVADKNKICFEKEKRIEHKEEILKAQRDEITKLCELLAEKDCN